MRSSQSTLETLQGDMVWNPIVFNQLLFLFYVRGGPAKWAPEHFWKPADTPIVKVVNLPDYAFPQSFLIGAWKAPKQGGVRILWLFYFTCLLLGPLLLGCAGGLVETGRSKNRQSS
jgi:hypothetical protein